MTAQLTYAMHHLLLRTIDTTCFSWHGLRPLAWQRKLIDHRFRAPHAGQVVPFGTPDEQAMLAAAQALYPDNHMYLAVGSHYSPWYGYTWHHHVKVVVRDSTGTPPDNKYGGGGAYGMPFENFKQSEWAQHQKMRPSPDPPE